MKYWFHILKDSNSLGIISILTLLITVMGLLSPIFIIHIFNRYIAFGLQGTLFFLLTGALTVAIFEYIFRNVRNKILSDMIVNPIKTFKMDLLKKFFEYETKRSNSSIFDLIDFKNNFYLFMSPKIQSNLFDAIFATLIILILFFLDTKLAFVFLILIAAFLILQYRLIKKKKDYLKSLNLSNKDRLIMKELSVNIELLRSNHSLKYSGFFLNNYLEKKLDIDSSVSMYDAKQISTTSFFILLSSISTIGIGSMFVVEGNLSIGSLIGFNIFATRALGTISSVQNSYFVLEKTKIYLEECNEFFKNSKNRAEGMQLSKLLGNIELKDINFSYDSDEKYIVKNFSAKFLSSEITVVTGKNGSGKTTISKLLVSLLKAESGKIYIDDTDLEKLSLVWFKNHIAYVPQEVDILNTSILNNILIANPSLNDQEVSRLLQNVGLDKELKNSNLTISDIIVNNLSRGIKKKIHVARSISKNFHIYIFDDPTLYLDKEGKIMVIKLLTSLKRAGKTVICFSEDKDIINLSDNEIKVK